MSWDISHHERLKPKKESTFKKKSVMKKKAKVVKKDLDYLDWLHEENCFTCMVCKSSNVEFHHVKRDSTDKKDHKRLIPLCQNHHTISRELSAHSNPKKFREVYPMEFQYILADKIYKQYMESIK